MLSKIILYKHFNPMTRIETSKELFDKLKILDKYCSKITVRHNSLTSHNTKITMNTFTNTEFTVNVKELIAMLNVTNEFELSNKIYYKYSIDVGGVSILFNRKIKVFEERFDIPYANPRFSIVVPNFTLLSTDDHLIEVEKSGDFSIKSDGYVKTGTSFTGLTVAFAEIEKFRCKVRYKSLQLIEEFQNELIFSFFDDHIMVHILEEPEITNILLIPVLID